MLVLTRKSEQKIRIGKDVVITVLKVQGDQVSIGIEAPRALPIYREEVLKAIMEENEIAAESQVLSHEQQKEALSSLSKAIRSRAQDNPKTKKSKENHDPVKKR
jgi:carbon storage regulator